MLATEIIDVVKNYLKQQRDVAAAYVFGSVARDGRHVIVHDYDDIDPVIIFAILRSNPGDFRVFARSIKGQFLG